MAGEITRDPRVLALGSHIRRLRSGLGISASELAQRSGLSRTALWKIESGTGNPTYTTILEIADALGVSEHMLIPPRSPSTTG